MRVFDLLTGSAQENHRASSGPDEKTKESNEAREREQTVRDKIEKYSDYDLPYEKIAMPEIEVTVYFADTEETLGQLDTVMKTKHVLRYKHLARTFVDERDYPPSSTYFLYSCGEVRQTSDTFYYRFF